MAPWGSSLSGSNHQCRLLVVTFGAGDGRLPKVLGDSENTEMLVFMVLCTFRLAHRSLAQIWFFAASCSLVRAALQRDSCSLPFAACLITASRSLVLLSFVLPVSCSDALWVLIHCSLRPVAAPGAAQAWMQPGSLQSRRECVGRFSTKCLHSAAAHDVIAALEFRRALVVRSKVCPPPSGKTRF